MSRALEITIAIAIATAGCAPSRDRDDDDAGQRGDVCVALGTCEGPPPPDAGDIADDSWPAAWAALEDEILTLVNEARTAGVQCPSGARPPVPALAMEGHLRTAARLHSQDMAEQGYFDHFSPDGQDPFARMDEAGYEGQPGGENIAGGNATAQRTFDQWIGSDGHCRNMTSRDFTEIGVGYAFDAESPFGHYWTQTFGSR